MFLGKTEEDFNKLIQTDSRMLCHYTGFPSVNIFTELFEYMKDAITQLDDVPKHIQLLAVLAKLHLNIDSFCIHPYKFPAIYVSVINALYEQLGFMWKMTIQSWSMPKSFKTRCYINGDAAIVGVLKISFTTSSKNIRFPYVQYLIGYTCQGEVFFTSRLVIILILLHNY